MNSNFLDCWNSSLMITGASITRRGTRGRLREPPLPLLLPLPLVSRREDPGGSGDPALLISSAVLHWHSEQRGELGPRCFLFGCVIQESLRPPPPQLRRLLLLLFLLFPLPRPELELQEPANSGVVDAVTTSEQRHRGTPASGHAPRTTPAARQPPQEAPAASPGVEASVAVARRSSRPPPPPLPWAARCGASLQPGPSSATAAHASRSNACASRGGEQPRRVHPPWSARWGYRHKTLGQHTGVANSRSETPVVVVVVVVVGSDKCLT